VRHAAASNGRVALAVTLVVLAAPLIGYLATTHPLQVLIGLASLAVIVFLTLRVELAILLLVASAPLEFFITLGSSSTLTLSKLTGGIAFAAFALNALATKRRLIFDMGHGLVFLLLGIALLSMTQAADLSAAVTTTTRYASFVALFFLLSQFVGGHNLQRRIAWTLSLGSCVTGIAADWNFLSGHTLQARLAQGDPNDIAFILATTLPFTVWLLRERGIRRWIALLMIPVIAVSIILTLSRGALLGLSVGLLAYLFFEQRNVRALLATLAAITVAFVLVLELGGHSIQNGLHAKEKVANTNVQTRLEAWDAAARLAVAHPFLGVGPSNFRLYYLAATGHPPGTTELKVVHDAYLDVASELGIGAFIVFLAYLVLAFARLTSAVRRGLGSPQFASACRVSLVIAVVAALTLTEQYFAPFWLLGGLASALIHESSGAPTGS